MHWISWVLLVAVVGMSVALAVHYALKLRGRQRTETVHHLKCPHCRRRLRYRSRQAGRAGMCPRCRQKLVFPAIVQEAESPRR